LTDRSRADRRPAVLRGALCVTALLALAGRARAQDAGAPGDTLAACPDGRISRVFVDNHSVFDLSDPELEPRLDWAYRLANDLHVATKEEVIRRELLFREGDCYDVERLRESERLLRETEFIARVDVFGIRQPDGSVHVLVDTQDEWSLRADMKVGGSGGSGLTGVRLREDNLFGSGQRVFASYRRYREEQVYGAGWFAPQLFGTRLDATLEGGRTRVGYLFDQSIAYPFVGEVGRWSFRQSVQHSDYFFEFLVPEGDGLTRVWLPERRESFELGTAVRFGPRRLQRTLVGLALVGERVEYPAVPTTLAADSDRIVPALPGVPLDTIASVRAMFLLGQRNVYYVRRHGLDSVNGTEDVRLGVEAEAAFSPSLPGLTETRDLALDFGFSAATPLGDVALVGVGSTLEARRDYDSPVSRSEWSDVLAQADAWAYLQPAEDSRSVLVAAVTAVGGWYGRTPFQVSLGGYSGLRGYPRFVAPGGRRVVGSLEARRYLAWPLPDLFDLGAAAFVDAGKVWAGDAPFGVDSRIHADVGLGLRAAFPPGSRRTLRLDVGVPIKHDLKLRQVVVTVGVAQLIGFGSLHRDAELLRSTRMGSAASAFVFPRY
jgi:hypothetical protein